MEYILLFLSNFETWLYLVILGIFVAVIRLFLELNSKRFASFINELRWSDEKSEQQKTESPIKSFEKFGTLDKSKFLKDKFRIDIDRFQSYNRPEQSKEYKICDNIHDTLNTINQNYPNIVKKTNELSDVVFTHVNVICNDQSLIINNNPYKIIPQYADMIIAPLQKLYDGLCQLKRDEEERLKKIKLVEEEEKKKLAEVSLAQYNENMNKIFDTIDYATKRRSE